MNLGKKFGAVALLLIFCLCFVACGSDGNGQADGAGEAVRIGLLSIDDSLPFFAAQELGYFEDAGVSVDLLPFGSAKDKDMALEAGELDGVMTDLIVTALMKKSSTDVKIVSIALGADASEGRFVILAAPDSGIETMEDLKGVPVAVGNNTIVHYLSETLEAMNGFTADEIQTQNIPDLGLRYEALMSGKDVKAAVFPDPLAALGEMQGAKNIIDDSTLDVNLSQSVVIFSQKSLDKKSAELEKVMDAYYQAMTYLNENQNSEEVRTWHQEFCQVPAELQNSIDTPTYTPGVLPEEGMIASVMDWMVEKGLLEEAFTYEEMVCEDFLIN